VVAELVADPETVLEIARSNLSRWASQHRADSSAARALAAWSACLDQGLGPLIDALLSTSADACEMRQNSPFAGVLPDERRRDVLRSFSDHWRNEHAAATA
jgi:hypothetical protein